MRKVISVILIIVLIAVLWQVFVVTGENRKLRNEFDNLASQLEAIKKENEKLKSDLEYYSKPENLEKELRSRLNYKKPGEQTIIITQ